MSEDIEVRVKKFNEEFMPLLGKYELGLGAVAKLTTDGRITAEPTLVDASKKEEEPEEKLTVE